MNKGGKREGEEGSIPFCCIVHRCGCKQGEQITLLQLKDA